MADAPETPSTPVQPPVPISAEVPLPHGALKVTRIKWKAQQPIHRIHSDKFAADEFNPKFGNARFSPIKNAKQEWIPTLYGGDNFECAALETIFHDVPFAPGPKPFAKSKLVALSHSELIPASDLVLVDLRNLALRKLGIERRQLIDTEKDCYAFTRNWAAAIHKQCADAMGMLWTSRQDDSSRAIILFKDRVPRGVLRDKQLTRSLIGDEATYSRVLDLAERIGVQIIDPAA